MVWTNGYIPEGDLVVFNRGHNSIDGDWFWALTPGTLARHKALVERARRRTGRTLEPSDGYSTYRPYGPQVTARRLFGNGAAVPGTSSHGGFWEGRETLAIDYGNWSWVYGGDRAAFYEDCRAVGLTPGMIEPRRGYPDEPWHVIDLNPRAAVPASADAAPFTPQEEDDMFSDADRAALNQVAALASHAIRDETRQSVFFVDEMGADHVLDYKSDDIQLAEFLASLGATFGMHDVDSRTFDIAVAIATRRWTAKVDAIATATAAKVAALVSGKPIVIDPTLIRQAVSEALTGVGTTEISPATIDAIANRVADVQHARLAS